VAQVAALLLLLLLGLGLIVLCHLVGVVLAMLHAAGLLLLLWVLPSLHGIWLAAPGG
jgi:hypothetical protein